MKDGDFMCGIANIASLDRLLKNEHPEWPQIVFDKIGVWVEANGVDQSDWDLYSNCGRTTLDYDVERCWQSGIETTKCIDINSISELIEYIQRSETYHDILKNINFGKFTKAELFWSIQSRIMHVNRYEDGSYIYGLRAIHNERDGLWFDTSVCGIDEISGYYLHSCTEQTTLDEAVQEVGEQFLSFYNQQGELKRDIPPFKFDQTITFCVPQTAEDVVREIKSLQY